MHSDLISASSFWKHNKSSRRLQQISDQWFWTDDWCYSSLAENIYRDSDKDASTICTVPYNKDLSVCITQYQFQESDGRGGWFHERREKMGIHSTYFIQTEIHPWPGSAIFSSNDDFKKLRDLFALEWICQSNSVSALLCLIRFEQGNGWWSLSGLPTLCHGLGQKLTKAASTEKCAWAGFWLTILFQ